MNPRTLDHSATKSGVGSARQYHCASLIAGNREVVFNSSAISISAQEAGHQEHYAKTQSHNTNSRVEKSHHNNSERLNWLLFRLKALSDDVNKQYRQAHLKNEHGELESINAGEPTELVNQALAFASIPIHLDWNAKSELLAIKNDKEYGIQDMSDGERAAIVLTGETLLAEKNALMLIDEPERHLHRSISSPLFKFLRSIRLDLSWVIAMHDLSLPRDDESASLAILYEYYGKETWNAEIIPDTALLPPSLADAIYGARKQVIFVEGNYDTSLDLPLYKVIFPRYTVVPVGACRDVQDSTLGLAKANHVHHMEARGIVDGDNRSDAETLRKEGVEILGVYSIESVYYHPDVIQQMAARSGEVATVEEVFAVAVDALRQSRHLVRKTAYKKYREIYFSEILDQDAFSARIQEIPVIDGPSILADAQNTFDRLIDQQDWLGLAERYKIKESTSPNAIARKLGFKGAPSYERAVQKALNDHDELRCAVSRIVPDPFAAESD